MIELDEGLQRDAEPLAIIQQGAVMIGNAPRARIEIEALFEAAVLGRATELGKTCRRRAASNCARRDGC